MGFNTSPLMNNGDTKSELKRAFTIVPKTSINKQSTFDTIQHNFDEASSDDEVHPYIKNDFNRSKPEIEEWPNIEQLEAIIRGEGERVAHDTLDNIDKLEQLELPLTFDTAIQELEEKSTKMEYINPDVTSNASKLMSELQPIKESDQKSEEFSTVDGQFISNGHHITVAWSKVVIAVSSSIITGVLIGYVLLLAVYGVNVWPISILSSQLSTEHVVTPNSGITVPNNSSADNSATQSLVADGVMEDTTLTTEQVVTEKKVIQPMQTFTYAVLQAGVFTKEDTRQAMVDQLRGKGFPAASIPSLDNTTVVIAGVASGQQATHLTNHMDSVDLYRKAFQVHIPQLSTDAVVDEKLQQWMFDVHDLMKSYMLMGEAQFEQSSLSRVLSDSFTLLIDKHEQVVSSGTKLHDELTDESLKGLVKYHYDELNEIQKDFNTYQDKPTKAALFQVQQHLLNIIVYQMDLIEN